MNLQELKVKDTRPDTRSPVLRSSLRYDMCVAHMHTELAFAVRDPEYVLVITYWSYADALVQTILTLPRIMLGVCPWEHYSSCYIGKDGNAASVQEDGIVHILLVSFFWVSEGR